MEILPANYVEFNTRHSAPAELTFSQVAIDHSMDYLCGSAHILIDSEHDLNITVGGAEYTLEKGRHYFPFLPMFHEFRIMAGQTYKVYTVNTLVCSVAATAMFHCLLVGSNFVVYPCIKDLSGAQTIMKGGMLGSGSDIMGHLQECPASIVSSHKYEEIPGLYGSYLYCTDIESIREDPDVTKYLVLYDKDIVRQSHPPCILVSYREENREHLTMVLRQKYGIELRDGNLVTIKVPKTAEEIRQEAAKTRTEILRGYEKIKDYITVNWSPSPI